MSKRIFVFPLLIAFATALAGCRDAAGPRRSFGSAAGVYLLATVNGQPVPTSDRMAPLDGAIYLWPTGHVERHVVFRRYDGRTETVESVGSYHFEGDALILELRPKGDRTPDAWVVTASLQDRKITLGYPGPADGWLNEEYRRQ